MSNTTTTPGPTTSPPPTPTPTTTPPPPPPPPPTSTDPPPPPPTTSSQPPPTTSTPVQPTTIVTTSIVTNPTNGEPTTLVTTVVTSTPATLPTGGTGGQQGTTTSSGTINPTDKPSSGLSNEGRIAIAVVVPIAAVALLILAGIFFWRKRKARKDAEEERRKEVEDYTYNPNADPTIPAVAGGYEMKEDGSSGYRGWGSTTLAGSTGRKASTTMSGGAAGGAHSDATSPTRAGVSDTRSGDNIHDGTHSPEGEILGAMGPPAAGNRGGDIRRGPSNASSSYSAAARSDGSGEGPIGAAYGGDATYYNQYGSNNPYAENQFGSPQRPSELTSTPVIRDNPARRNTRIENPAHYPQQSAGISQNF